MPIWFLLKILAATRYSVSINTEKALCEMAELLVIGTS